MTENTNVLLPTHVTPEISSVVKTSTYELPVNTTYINNTLQIQTSIKKFCIIFIGYLLGSGLVCLTPFSPIIKASPVLIAISFLFSLLTGLACIEDLAIFGEQKRPHQWILSITFILALTILSIRLFMPMPSLNVEAPSTLGWFGETLITIFKKIQETIPPNFKYIFEIWKVLFALFSLLVIMRLKRIKTRLYLLLTLFIVPTLFLFSNNNFLSIIIFLIGLLPIIIALYLHYEPIKGSAEIKAILLHLKPLFDENPELVRNILHVAVCLHEGNPINQNEIKKDLTLPPEEVISHMINLGMVITYASKERQTIKLDSDVRFLASRRPIFAVLHKGILVLIAIGWALLPYDLIPDKINFYGCLDDILVAFLIFRILSKK